MNNINETQVQSTNDASTLSKHSAVCKNYFSDDFIREFVIKKKSRASLIHLGYYTRAIILNRLILDFISFMNHAKISKFQIVSLGAGFDTTYWKLSEACLLDNSIFVEIDFPSVIQQKIHLINQSEKLSSYLGKFNSLSQPNNINKINKLNFNYFLLEADLCDIILIEKLFHEIEINCEIPTLFISECVITYMKECSSRKLIEWMSKKFKNCAFINYEQIHPDDGFGQIMLKHFDKLQSSLFSVGKYPDCESHHFRFKNLGFESSRCLSEWDTFVSLVSEEERKRAFLLELFDEFEEFHLKCVHYVIAMGANGLSSRWINSLNFENERSDAICRSYVRSVCSDCDLELFRHIACNDNDDNGVSYVFGGCTRKNRSCEIYKIIYGNHLDIKTIHNSEENKRSDIVYGSGVHFKLNRQSFVCLYGGRTSPDKVWNDGSPVLYELLGEEFSQRLIIRMGNPVPRYRTQMTSISSNENEVSCWLFGGRTADLNISLSDLWKLTIKQEENERITAEWTQQQQQNGDDWPCGRMSHSLCSSSDRQELFLIGGLTGDSFQVLNDFWKWSCSNDRWEKVELSGKLLPRYGHSSHLKDDVIYLVGGVNTMAGSQPELAIIDLKKLTVFEYNLSSPSFGAFLLINHTSHIIKNENGTVIWIIGGGGNCFSFGTHINQSALCICLDQICFR